MKRIRVWIEWIYLLLAVVSCGLIFVPEKEYEIVHHLLYILFALEYLYRLYRSEQKMSFILKHPIDLSLLLPLSSGFRIIRFLRLWKLLRLNRRFEKIFPKVYTLFRAHQLGLLIGWFLFFALAVSLPLTMIEPQMSNYMDALWWTIVTTTTIGYGDLVPVTWLGRSIAVFMMLFGIGLVSLLIGNLSKIFTREDGVEPQKMNLDLARFEELDKEAQVRIQRRLEEEIELELYKKEKKALLK